MPPKRAGSKSASSASSSSGSSSSGSSSSGSSSSSSSGSSSSDSDSDSSNSNSKKSSSSDSSDDKSKKQKTKKPPSRRPSTNALPTTRTTRSSASSASESESTNKSKQSKQKPVKAGSAIGGKNDAKASTKVAPKKSATAKPKAGDAKSSKKSSATISEDDSDSDPFGAFSMAKLAAKAQQAKKAAMAASSSPGSQPSPSVKPPATPTSTTTSLTSKATPSTASKASTSAKAATSAADAGAGKYKNIFSESSEDSDDEVTTKKPTLPASSSRKQSSSKQSPGKSKGSGVARLAAAAAAKKAATAAKKKTSPAKPTKKKGRTRSASTESSSSSSGSDSSESDAEVTIKKPTPAPPAKKSKKPVSKSKSATTTAAQKKKADAAKKAAVAAMDSEDSEATAGPKTPRSTRRQTRGNNARKKSIYITGKNVDESESETEAATDRMDSAPSGSTSPRKRVNSEAKDVKGSANGFAAANLLPVRRDLDGLDPMEQRKCPIPGCDSSGHLGGKLDRHFLAEACPVYHNTTPKWCRDFRSEVSKKNTARKRAVNSMAAKSPLGSPTNEQRRHSDMVKNARSKFRPDDVPETDEITEDRELEMKGFTLEWDLNMFREAQAAAAEDQENALKGLPDTKQPRYIEFGRHEMEVWYQSPYPEEYSCLPKLFICEFCLKYLKSATQLRRHASKCVWNHPPGDEIYRKEPISVFEICGKRYKQYCQSLCLLAKFFLDHKTLYFDVEPFLFYVMTTADSSGCHIVGYFSKEKNSMLNYNVSCILTLPPYQRQGFGRLLIDFSYLLSRAEGKIGSPEKPLSDLGLMTYRAYWKDVLLEYICNYPEREISIKGFCDDMGINPYDIVSTLQYLGMIKYWKGHHIILKKEDIIDVYVEKSRSRPRGRQIYPAALKWKPYEPTAKERRQAEQIKKNQEERQKKR